MYLSGFVTGTQSSPRKASFIASTMDVVKQCFADPKYLPDKGKVITKVFFTNAEDVFGQHKKVFSELPEAQAITVSNPIKMTKYQLQEVAQAEHVNTAGDLTKLSRGELCDKIVEHRVTCFDAQSWSDACSECGCGCSTPPYH